MTYKIETRLKCISRLPRFTGWYGKTGVLVDANVRLLGADIRVRLDQSAVDGKGVACAAGTVYETASSQWEPILPEGHRAGDFSFSELMDKCRAGEGVPA